MSLLFRKIVLATVAVCLALPAGLPALADPGDRGPDRDEHRGHREGGPDGRPDEGRRDEGRRDEWRRDEARREEVRREPGGPPHGEWHHDDHRDGYRGPPPGRPWGPDWRPEFRPHDHYTVIVNRRPVFVPPERRRIYRDVVVLRPYGPWYYGYGHYYRDEDAYFFLGLSAISLSILAMANEAQIRALEDAQIRAATAPVGQRIIWTEPGASGYVTPTREGHTTDGRYCREFQQTVTIGGRTEQAYGTACQQPDGAWQVVN